MGGSNWFNSLWVLSRAAFICICSPMHFYSLSLIAQVIDFSCFGKVCSACMLLRYFSIRVLDILLFVEQNQMSDSVFVMKYSFGFPDGPTLYIEMLAA